MTSQQYKVQAYLEKHKVGALFEGLMLRLTRDMPDEPLRYLLDALAKKIARAKTGISSQEFNVTDHPVSKGKVSVDHLRRTINDFHSAMAAEAAGDAAPTKRDYPKPWKASYAKGVGDHREDSTSDTKDADVKGVRSSSGSRQVAENGSKVPATTVDPFASRESGTNIARARAPTADHTVRGKDARSAHQRTTKMDSASASATIASAEDTLANELLLSSSETRERAIGQDLSALASPASTTEYRGLSKKKAVEVQKAELRRALAEQLVAVDGPKQSTSESSSQSMDDMRRLHTAITEDLILPEDSLTAVGSSLRRRGSLSRENQQHASSLTVAVCAVCARMLATGDVGGRSVASSAEEQASAASSDVTLRTHSAARGPAAAAAAPDAISTPVVSARRSVHDRGDDGEEEAFESVSQVSGPRVPVWSPRAGRALTGSGQLSTGGVRLSSQQIYSHGSKAMTDPTQRSLRAEDLKVLPVSSQIDSYFASERGTSQQQQQRGGDMRRIPYEASRGTRAAAGAEDEVNAFAMGNKMRGWRT